MYFVVNLCNYLFLTLFFHVNARIELIWFDICVTCSIYPLLIISLGFDRSIRSVFGFQRAWGWGMLKIYPQYGFLCQESSKLFAWPIQKAPRCIQAGISEDRNVIPQSQRVLKIGCALGHTEGCVARTFERSGRNVQWHRQAVWGAAKVRLGASGRCDAHLQRNPHLIVGCH